MKRCFGDGIDIYEKYHDDEWGVIVTNDRTLFEMIILEGAHAGLSWLTILKKREGYRKQFYNFNVAEVANMTEFDIQNALKNKEIVRNRLKVYSTRKNAQIYISIQKEYGSFARYLWEYVDYTPLQPMFSTLEETISTSEISDQISKDLKKKGMSFVGSTCIYSYMQAIGMTNDHLTKCPRFKELSSKTSILEMINNS